MTKKDNNGAVIPDALITMTVVATAVDDERGKVRISLADGANGAVRFTYKTDASGAPRVLDTVTMALAWPGG